VTHLKKLISARDTAIAALWVAFRDLSDELPADSWTVEDLDLWGVLTKHEAVQSRLRSVISSSNKVAS